MPRPPTHRHPLREIREVLGKTQAEFAGLIGTSAVTVKRIENGTLTLSDKLAARIWAATGAMQIELLKGSNGKALGLDGSPYTVETFERWNEQWNLASPAKAIRDAQQLAEFVELVCVAATRGDHPSLRSVYTALAAAIDEVCRDYGLDSEVAKLFEEEGITRRSLPTGGEYSVINPSLGHLVDNAYYRLGKENPGSPWPFGLIVQ